MLSQGAAFAATGGAHIEFVEPDTEQEWFPDTTKAAQTLAAATCTFHPQDESGRKAVTFSGNDWHLQNQYSQLAIARNSVTQAEQQAIKIAHLDTGYDPNHATLPLHLDMQNQRNFRDQGRLNDATDRTPNGWTAIRNQGHGHATLSLLAGNQITNAPASQGFAGFIGGAPYATIIPIRIADWIVRFSTSTMVQGFQYAVDQGAHVLSMSMGGLTSRALADAVNLAYENGLFMVTAAGNNYAKSPTPGSVVFPARFKRVLAACGVMADGRACVDNADSNGRLHAKRAMGGVWMRQARQHGWRGYLLRNTAASRRRCSVDGQVRAGARGLPRTLDASRGRAIGTISVCAADHGGHGER
jgi:subtilisin family serine protease